MEGYGGWKKSVGWGSIEVPVRILHPVMPAWVCVRIDRARNANALRTRDVRHVDRIDEVQRVPYKHLLRPSVQGVRRLFTWI